MHPIWKPSKETIANSQMRFFIEYINNKHQVNFKNYQELYTWSIANPDEFWIEVWNFCGIKSSKLWDTPLIHGDNMRETKWFVGAGLNFAENLLQRRDNKIAIIFQNEKNERRTLSYEQLFLEVAKLAKALKKAGIKKHDRVAGFLPNMPETIIAMLATTSLGAIWTACSPDFGARAVIDRFGQIEPKILFTTDGHFYNGKTFDDLPKIHEITQQLPSLKQIIVIPYLQKNPEISQLSNAVIYQDFIKEPAAEIDFAQLAFDHPVYILYSSGTTGVPKCIVHGAGGTLIQHLKELMLHTNVTENDTIFYYTTCGWMMWHWLISSLAIGATVVLYDGAALYPTPAVLFDLIDNEKISIFGTSAKYISAIEKAKLVPNKTHRLNTLKSILSTGSPLLPENFDYVYQRVKHDLCLSSISGGTDIISCFALGNPILPVYRGELQCIGLGLQVEIFNEYGESVVEEKGELVCTAPFPSMPIYFWNDPEGKKYQYAYFEKFPGIWAHGDYAEITSHQGVIIYGRSDAILKPSGIRIGTAEIYRQTEKIDEILESLAVGQEWQGDTRIILFVKLRENTQLTEELKDKIKKAIHDNASPHHVPAKIIQVADIPRTVSGKIVELAVREVIHGRPVKNIDALANPEALEYFKNLDELK